MSGLFHSLLSKKHAEPECLTAQGIAARLERMFSEAASYIIIVSPYIKLNLRLRDILGEKKKAGVDITIIHKGLRLRLAVGNILHEAALLSSDISKSDSVYHILNSL